MDDLKRQEKIQELERQIAGLPIGYISKERRIKRQKSDN